MHVSFLNKYLSTEGKPLQSENIQHNAKTHWNVTGLSELSNENKWGAAIHWEVLSSARQDHLGDADSLLADVC